MVECHDIAFSYKMITFLILNSSRLSSGPSQNYAVYSPPARIGLHEQCIEDSFKYYVDFYVLLAKI